MTNGPIRRTASGTLRAANGLEALEHAQGALRNVVLDVLASAGIEAEARRHVTERILLRSREVIANAMLSAAQRSAADTAPADISTRPTEPPGPTGEKR